MPLRCCLGSYGTPSSLLPSNLSMSDAKGSEAHAGPAWVEGDALNAGASAHWTFTLALIAPLHPTMYQHPSPNTETRQPDTPHRARAGMVGYHQPSE